MLQCSLLSGHASQLSLIIEIRLSSSIECMAIPFLAALWCSSHTERQNCWVPCQSTASTATISSLVTLVSYDSCSQPLQCSPRPIGLSSHQSCRRSAHDYKSSTFLLCTRAALCASSPIFGTGAGSCRHPCHAPLGCLHAASRRPVCSSGPIDMLFGIPSAQLLDRCAADVAVSFSLCAAPQL